MAAGVDDVEPGPEDTDRGPAGVERAGVRGAVDADREPAHHGHTRVREHRAELGRVGEAVWCRRAGADDRDPGPVERVRARTLGEQHRRHVGELRVDGVVGAARQQHAGPPRLEHRRGPVQVDSGPPLAQPARSDRAGGWRTQSTACPPRGRGDGVSSDPATRRAACGAAPAPCRRARPARQPRCADRRARRARSFTARPDATRPPARCARLPPRARRRDRRSSGRRGGRAPRRDRSASRPPRPASTRRVRRSTSRRTGPRGWWGSRGSTATASRETGPPGASTAACTRAATDCRALAGRVVRGRDP